MRQTQRQGFLLSATFHVVFLSLLISYVRAPGREREAPQPSPTPEVRQRVFLPPPQVLRQLLPRPAPTPLPPEPAPAEPRQRDRISIGPPSDVRQKGPLILRREDDLTQIPKGRPDSAPSAPATPPPTSTVLDGADAAVTASPSPGGQVTKDGSGPLGTPAPRLAERGSISQSLRNLASRMGDAGPRGIESGAGKQMGPLFFDPEGADFTAWINHFKNEVYRNWIAPQAAIYGYSRGHADFEFTVERDGTLTNLRMIKSTGTPALDRAAQNALLGSRLLPLPADFGPPRTTMQVAFFYGEPPQGS